jgi:hypothetical protein
MAKIASSCENCIFGVALKPREMPVKPVAEQRKFLGIAYTAEPDETELMIYDLRLADYEMSLNRVRCTRFPKTEIKHKDDLCGEHLVK